MIKGGKGDDTCKHEFLNLFTIHTNNVLNGKITTHEASILYSQKLIGIPKDETKVRAIMMINTESKLIWSVFIHSRYKKGLDSFPNQYGSSSVGCEKSVHRTRYAAEINPKFDTCTPDAEKAYYHLSRLEALKQGEAVERASQTASA